MNPFMKPDERSANLELAQPKSQATSVEKRKPSPSHAAQYIGTKCLANAANLARFFLQVDFGSW
jgi:hypothetical protein